MISAYFGAAICSEGALNLAQVYLSVLCECGRKRVSACPAPNGLTFCSPESHVLDCGCEPDVSEASFFCLCKCKG